LAPSGEKKGHGEKKGCKREAIFVIKKRNQKQPTGDYRKKTKRCLHEEGQGLMATAEREVEKTPV